MAHTTIDVPAPQEHRLTMSYDEFLAWAGDGTHAEWVDGQVIVDMPPNAIHQRIVVFLVSLLSLYVRSAKLGIILTAPFEMRVRPDGPAREPDILFLASDHLDRLSTERLSGPADLIIEIVSDSSVVRDRVDKFYEYQDAGVGEYWLIDPRPGKERVDVYWLTPEGQYQATIPDDLGRYHATVIPGCWFHPAWLWQSPMPDPLVAFAEIRGLTPDAINAVQRLLEPTTDD